MSKLVVTEEAQIIARAMRFPLDQVRKRYIRDFGIDAALASEHERELRRFLIVCALAPPGRSISMRGVIDDFWHTFLLYTYTYQRFCVEVFGRFIHHVPAEPGVRNPRERRGYVTFLNEYERIFGVLPPVAFWPALLPTGDTQGLPSITTGGECLFECDKCYPGCEPVPCDNREPIDEGGTDTDTDSDSDHDDDNDNDEDSDVDIEVETPSGP
ncbi:MAG TPA: hypothetical protein VFS24_17800 [Steroidobacteraceae bacterium]|nr:hypothetical protein [Steroidobacteraceae bacterium]